MNFLPTQMNWLPKCSDFFQDWTYTDDIVDILVRVTCDSLKVNLNIYQQTKDLLQCIPMKTESPAKDIYLKFTHNNLNPQGNHYDAIINSRKCSRSGIIQWSCISTKNHYWHRTWRWNHCCIWRWGLLWHYRTSQITDS